MSADQHYPPRPPETYGRQPVEGEGRLRRLAASPFFVISVVVAAFLLLGVLLIVALQFQGAPPLVVPGAMRATMSDGSILWLKVTSGTQHEFMFEHPEPDALERIFDPTNSQHLNTNTNENRFVIWLMRQDPVRGRPLDFDWWSHSSVIDEHGRELVDDNAYRESLYRYGSRGEGGSRPFSPLEPQEYNGIAVHSELPFFRHSGQTFSLRIHNTEGEVVARFAVPYELPFQPPVWTAEELPVTKTRGELAVTLQNVVYEDREYRHDDRTEQVLHVQPKFELAYAGKPTDVWEVHILGVSDPLGNTDSLWRCELDRREAAWRLRLRAARTSEAEFTPEEIWRVEGLKIPEANKLQVLAQSQTLQGAQIRLALIGGSGRTTHHAADPTRRSGGGSSGGSFQTADRQRVQYDIDVDYQNGTKSVSVDCPLPYVAFERVDLHENQSLLIRGVDEDGQPIPTHMNTTVGDLSFAFLEPRSTEKAIDLTFIVHRTHEFEFFIRPPPVEPKADD